MREAIKTRMKPGDIHIVVSASEAEGKAFNYLGQPVGAKGRKPLRFNALCEGQHDNWRLPQGDTPPGLYKAGIIYEQIPGRDTVSLLMSYGRFCIDLIDLEGQETNNGRAGISIHGGGTALKDPLAPYQTLLATLGCIRVHNQDLEQEIVPLVRETQKRGNTVYVSVIP